MGEGEGYMEEGKGRQGGEKGKREVKENGIGREC